MNDKSDEIIKKASALRKICIDSDIPLIVGIIHENDDITTIMQCDTEKANIILDALNKLNEKNAEFWKEKKASDEKLKKVSNE